MSLSEQYLDMNEKVDGKLKKRILDHIQSACMFPFAKFVDDYLAKSNTVMKKMPKDNPRYRVAKRDNDLLKLIKKNIKHKYKGDGFSIIPPRETKGIVPIKKNEVAPSASKDFKLEVTTQFEWDGGYVSVLKLNSEGNSLNVKFGSMDEYFDVLYTSMHDVDRLLSDINHADVRAELDVRDQDYVKKTVLGFKKGLTIEINQWSAQLDTIIPNIKY